MAENEATMAGTGNGEENKWTYLLIGFGLGAVGALLFAPRLREVRNDIEGIAFLFASRLGKEIREEIANTTQRGYETAHQISNELRQTGQEIAAGFANEAKETVNRSTERLSEVIGEAKETVTKSVERLSEIIDVGKQAYMEEKRKAEAGE